MQTTNKDAAYYVSTNAQSNAEGPIKNLVDGDVAFAVHEFDNFHAFSLFWNRLRCVLKKLRPLSEERGSWIGENRSHRVRRLRRKKLKPFFVAACTWQKILLALPVCPQDARSRVQFV